MLAEVLHSTVCPPSLPVEGARRREATVVEATCDLVISAISSVIISLEVSVRTEMHKRTILYTTASLWCKVSSWELPPLVPIAQWSRNQAICETPEATTETLWISARCKWITIQVSWSQTCVSGCFWIAKGYLPYAGITVAKRTFMPGRWKL